MDDGKNIFVEYWDKIEGLVVTYGMSFLMAFLKALAILLIGLWIVGFINRMVKKIFEKQNVDPSLRTFLGNLISWGLKILLFILVITQLGVEMSSFVAIIGAAGLAVGLALQGSLSNFAGGVLILTLKPFKVGDYISSSSGVSGTVKAIDIFNTRLNTPQNQLVVVPNGELSNSSITNYTELGTRRTWFDIGVSYDADLKQAKDILMDVISKNEHAYDDPAPQVVVTELGDSSVNLSIRVTTSNDVFWTMRENLIIDCKAALDNAGIEIPFPQRDVHFFDESKK
ncbi:small conductance mechanosensitive channel [Pustulibacterium marinum]|uniref:Small conductance mechanosensitive channel n=1 Tax=Pustulibacterium marinum TaxID=1224947 RepID=A0A1I7EZQ1_9FLAO|nr:mechanosensitive ion channel domain-containing protein [Pustulibacterium marinum]SFU29371.1 small conductance mechanosensitive channel [Pustulibacterium marinum]